MVFVIDTYINKTAEDMQWKNIVELLVFLNKRKNQAKVFQFSNLKPHYMVFVKAKVYDLVEVKRSTHIC